MTRPSPVQIWFKAARPRTWPAALGPVAIGTVLAWSAEGMHLATAIAAAVAALLIQVGTNFANDYFDFRKGADTETRLGEKRATQSGWVKPATMRTAFVVTFALAALVATGLLWRGGWPILYIGIASIASGILYTGGPRPLGYLGLGDVFVLVFFGPVAVAGTAYVQTLSFSWTWVWVGLVPGLVSTAILVVNNLRDVEQDRLAKKNTLAVRFGVRAARLEYQLCLLGAGGILLGLVALERAPVGALLPLAFAPLAFKQAQAIRRKSGADLDPELARTGKLLVAVSAALCLGWCLEWLWG